MAIDPQTILSASQAYADDMKGDLSSALDRLSSVATYQTWVGFAPRTNFDLTPVDSIPAGKLPALERAVFSGDLSDPAPHIETYKTHVFVAPFLDQMQTMLMEWVETGGVGISDAVQDALFNSMRERDLQVMNDALDAARSTDAKRGFRYATHRRRTSEVIINYQQTYENRNREITALLADLAQKNVHQAIASNVNIEQLHANFALGLSQIFFQLRNHLIERFRIEQEARIAEFEAKLKVILAGYNLDETNAKLDIAYQEQLMKKWEIDMVQSTERTKALIQQAEQSTQVKLEAIKGLVAGISAQVSAALLQSNGVAVSTAEYKG